MTNFDLRYSTLSSNGRSVIDITGKDLNDILTSGAYSGTNCYNSPVSPEIKIELIVTILFFRTIFIKNGFYFFFYLVEFFFAEGN